MHWLPNLRLRRASLPSGHTPWLAHLVRIVVPFAEPFPNESGLRQGITLLG
jgi:hypothetical protein